MMTNIYSAEQARQDMRDALIEKAHNSGRAEAKRKYFEANRDEIMDKIRTNAKEGLDNACFSVTPMSVDNFHMMPRSIITNLVVVFFNFGYRVMMYEHEDGISFDLNISWADVDEEDE